MIKMEKFLCMVGGAGDTSYSANSKLQEKTILKMRPMLKEAVAEMHKSLLPEKMVVADLGCSSGPNTLLVLSEVIKSISKQCQILCLDPPPPEMQFFCNDLPRNDFNNLFQLLDCFQDSLIQAKKSALVSVPHYVAALPGSFYGRLFPKESVHFFHSSYSLMWLSQVPQGLDNNKGNIYIGKTSPPLVVKLYQQQFQKDFSLFLKLRFTELVPGGRMVLAFLGRKNQDIYSGALSTLYGLISDSLNSIAVEGIVEEEKLKSFNLPIYGASMEEVKDVIDAQGLFDIIQMEMFESNWDPKDHGSDEALVIDNIESGITAGNCIRAVFESTIASHFGAGIVEEVFSRFAINVAKHLAKEKIKIAVLTLSLKKKRGEIIFAMW